MSTQRVVIFEADSDYAEELREVFSAHGWQVLLHRDGGDAAEVAEAAAPDLIVLSVELPNRSGFAICTQIKKHTALAEVPLLLIAGQTPAEALEQHAKLRTRADAYAHKPVSPEALFQQCNGLVHATRSAREQSQVIEVSEHSIVEALPQGALQPRDSDVSGITDAAFEHIMLGDIGGEALADDPVVMAEGLPPVPDDFEDFTTVSSSASLRIPPELLAQPAASSQRPPSILAPAMPPRPPPVPKNLGASVRPGPSREHAAELDGLRSQIATLETSLADAQRLAREAVSQQALSERERVESEAALRDARREIDELRLRAAKATEGRAGASTREFLELREALNRKDKEILNLRDEFNQRERDLLDLREKILHQDLARADLDDRLEERAREVSALRERLDVQRLESARVEELARGSASALESLRAEAEAAREAHERALGAQRDEAEAALLAALRGAEEAQRDALSSALKDHERALESLRAERAAALQTRDEAHSLALAARDEALRAKEIEHTEAIAAERARAATLESERDAARDEGASLQRALEAKRREATEALDEARGRIAALEARAQQRSAITERARRAADIAAALLDELAEHAESDVDQPSSDASI